MINLKPTPRHVENIKKHKGLFEKWKMWPFAYYDGNNYYFLTLYDQRFKGITGYLMLGQDGSVLPFEEAKEPAFKLINYNSIIAQTISEIIPQAYKDTSHFKETIKYLTKYRQNLIDADPRIESSIHQILEATEKTLGIEKTLKDAAKEISYAQKSVTDEKGYFDQALLDELRDESYKYSEVMYEYGIRETALKPHYEAVTALFKEKSVKLNLYAKLKIKDLMKLSHRSIDKQLKKSQSAFETDYYGEKVMIDKNRIKESLIEKRHRDGDAYFEELIIPIIRNPEKGGDS
ncbi:hypothetical protein [Sporosarcina sp. FSL K6-3457]|uniref:hypothetical protein n=1 Tax=Sporosarcina sp. FSL K6-3457 TaxID=2978204 RepID=UPI0030F6DDCD